MEVSCPFLDDGRCSIYEKRPSCCRSYPVDGGYCTSAGRCDEDCDDCDDKCCNHILVDRPMSPDELLEHLDMGCGECSRRFKG